MNLTKELKEDIKNIKLYIIGEGIDKYAYETFVEDNNLKNIIYILGKKDNVYPYINNCKYILLNTKEKLDKYLIPSLILNAKPISKCRYRDDIIDLGDNYRYKIFNTKSKQKEEILNILKTKPTKKQDFDFDEINKEKILNLLN